MVSKPTYTELEKRIKALEKTQKELLDSNERFKDLVDSLPQIVFETDEKGVLTYTNKDAFNYFGYTQSEFDKQLNVLQMIDPKDHDRAINNIYRILKGEILKSEEYTALRKDGTPFPVEIYSRFFFKKGKPAGLRGIIIDLREKKAIAAALRDSEHKLFFHLQNTPIGAVSWDLDFKTTEWNPAAETIFGYTRAEVIGRHASDLIIPPELKDIGDQILQKLIAKKGGSHSINENVTRDGRRITCDWYNTAMKDADGKVIGMASLVHDITERIQTEAALKASEGRYRSMMEAMTDQIYICSHDFHIEYMNPAMIDRIGYDATGEICHRVLYNQDEICSWCRLDQIQPGSRTIYEKEDTKNGRYYSISCSSVVHSDSPPSKLLILRDITRLKIMEKERAVAEAHLQQVQKMESIGTLAGGIAHDFNNILSPIMGYTEMLLEDVPEGSPSKESLNNIYSSALRAKDLVKQILTFSRQEKSDLKLMKMQPIIKEALKLIRSTIPSTIEIKQDINADCGVIKADPTQIHQITMNLATNAFHAMEEKGGELNVSLQEICLGKPDLLNARMEPGRYACLTIADNGIGMDKALIEKIFDPFFTTKRKEKGTGMGLSVVHGIVAGMAGAITVESQPGKGTQFHIYLPLARHFPDTRETPDIGPVQKGNEKILLVDDEEDIIKMEQTMLERLGYGVTSRTSSLEALEAFQADPGRFDLVITDLAMPNMPGNRLAEELTRIRPDIPILLCTGFSDTLSEEKASAMGLRGFLLKPIVMKDLSEKIRSVLDKKSAADDQ